MVCGRSGPREVVGRGLLARYWSGVRSLIAGDDNVDGSGTYHFPLTTYHHHAQPPLFPSPPPFRPSPGPFGPIGSGPGCWNCVPMGSGFPSQRHRSWSIGGSPARTCFRLLPGKLSNGRPDRFPSTSPIARPGGRNAPLRLEGLTYLTMSFYGFDGLAHTGEMMVAVRVRRRGSRGVPAAVGGSLPDRGDEGAGPGRNGRPPHRRRQCQRQSSSAARLSASRVAGRCTPTAWRSTSTRFTTPTPKGR